MTPTPPPWRVETGPERTGRQIAEIVEGRPGLAELRIVHDGPEEGDAKADADLMAAAPELRDALRSLSNEVRGLLGLEREAIVALVSLTNVRCVESRLKQAAEALRKAEGGPAAAPYLSEDRARLLQAAQALIAEYLSHGGPETHQECVPGCGFHVRQCVDALRAAVELAEGRQ